MFALIKILPNNQIPIVLSISEDIRASIATYLTTVNPSDFLVNQTDPIITVYKKVRGYIWGQYTPALDSTIYIVNITDLFNPLVNNIVQPLFQKSEAECEKLTNSLTKQNGVLQDTIKEQYNLLDVKNNEIVSLRTELNTIKANNMNRIQKIADEIKSKVQSRGSEPVKRFSSHPMFDYRSRLFEDIQKYTKSDAEISAKKNFLESVKGKSESEIADAVRKFKSE